MHGSSLVISCLSAAILPFCFTAPDSVKCEKERLAGPVYAQPVADTAKLRLQCEPLLKMTDEDLLKLVPPQGGFRYSGSPATTQGAQENNLAWDLSLGGKIKCIYTGILLPNGQYPENGYIDVPTPTGKIQRFHYHETPGGKKYWFEARRWHDQRSFMERAAYDLARLFASNPVAYRECGRRSALIMKRFAQVHPDYIIKYEWPGEEKVFLDEAAHRKAALKIDHHFIVLTRWASWGYYDMSTSLMLAYDQLRGTDILPEADIPSIKKMFEDMIAFTIPFEQVPLTNMHPTMWVQKAIAGNVLNRQDLVNMAIAGVERLLKEQFTYDGMYMEATVSYHDQTAGGLVSVLQWVFPELEKKQLMEKIRSSYPALQRTLRANEAYRFPDGRYAATNDAHWTDRQADPISRSEPALMPAAGHVVLGMGAGEKQFQAHLVYSGWHGHNHYGSLGLLLFAHGREMISDIGYTHTRARTWTMTTAAHNTVVIDGISQRNRKSSPRAGLGDLLLHSTGDPRFQAVEVRADDVYPGKAEDYRRTLVTVQADAETNYIVDLFQVSGGQRHDWILHGSADEAQELKLTDAEGKKLSLAPRKSLLPEGTAFEELQEQGGYELIWKDYWAYGHFKDIQAGKTARSLKATFRYVSDPELGHQTWLPLKREHSVYTLKSWNVRGANEDQGILDNYLRTGLLVRSEGNRSRFVAVHVPFKQNPGITEVRDVSRGEGTLVLKILHRSGTDYMVYRYDDSEEFVVIDGQKIRLKGKISLVKTSREGRNQLSTVRLTADLKSSGSDRLVVGGEMEVKPGQTAIIKHADGHTTAFRVDSVSVKQGETQLFTREPVPFRKNDNGSLEMTTFPFLRYPGPHEVSVDTFFVEDLRR